MDITAEDIKVCDCCGKPTVEGGVRKIDDVWLCEDCEALLALVVPVAKMADFIVDVASSFDLAGISQETNRLVLFESLAKVWRSFGLMRGNSDEDS
jgi:hypothetical protein